MLSLKNTILEYRNTTEIKGIVEVYEEIAATKMKEIRDAVILAEAYFDGLANLSNDVALDLLLGYQGKSLEAAVFLSSETGLHGDLLDKIMVTFVDFVKGKKIDIFVMGLLGESLMKSYAPEIKFRQLKTDNLKETMKFLAPYSKIHIFHGRFESIARQSAIGSTISGPEIAKYGATGGDSEIREKRFANIYEPGVNSISETFGNQISASIFDQSIKENQLAKYAARLMQLDSTIGNIDERLENLERDKRRTRKKIEQKKQTERMARWQRM